jgi:hypothetical protein
VLFGTGVSVTLVAANTQDYASGRASAAVFPPLILMILAVMTFAYRLAMQSFRAEAAGHRPPLRHQMSSTPCSPMPGESACGAIRRLITR